VLVVGRPQEQRLADGINEASCRQRNLLAPGRHGRSRIDPGSPWLVINAQRAQMPGNRAIGRGTRHRAPWVACAGSRSPCPLYMPPVGLVWATRHRDSPVVRNVQEQHSRIMVRNRQEGAMTLRASLNIARYLART
jgi:hypothetical protein